MPDIAVQKRRLVVSDLSAFYRPGLDIVKGVNLEAKPGEITCILGPNGAGKSTLLKAIFGLVGISGGTITIGDADVTGLATEQLAAEGVGFVPQTQNVFQALSVVENLSIGGRMPTKEKRDRIRELQTAFPLLRERGKQRAGTLSGGQRQLVALARALMMRPTVLLLDEPSAGLDPKSCAMIFAEIRKIAGTGVSVLMVEQNARQALRVSDFGYVLDTGRNAIEGPAGELLNSDELEELYLGVVRGPKPEERAADA